MEVAPHARRRKACDLCTQKRIKCDSLKPQCSNCKLYGVECLITVQPKQTPRNLNSTPIRKQESASSKNDRVHDIEARLARIESMMQAVSKGHTFAAPKNTVPSATTVSESSSTEGSSSFPMGSASGFGIQHDGHLELPPLDVILPVMQDFFHQYNHIVPLFHQKTFMTMVKNWQTERSPAEWAAIHVALALCFRLVYGFSMEDPRVVDSIAAAKSMVLDLMMRTEDHLGVQVLLGLAILSLGASAVTSHKDSAMYTSMACRLVQLMKLHLRSDGTVSFNQALPFDQVLHRSRLFWIAYYLDRDISIRFQVPYMLADEDINHALPSANPTDGIGNIYSYQNGAACLNYLQIRVQLAYIYGKVYDFTKPQAWSLPKEERAKQLTRINVMFSQWMAMIEPDFSVSNAAHNISGVALNHVAEIYHAQLLGLLVAHGIYKFDENVIDKLRLFCSHLDGLFESPDRTIFQESGVPSGWSECVIQSRACLRVFLSTKEGGDYHLWSNSCAIFGAGVLLLINLLKDPDSTYTTGDQMLIDCSLDAFDRLIEYGPMEKNALRADFQGLERHVRATTQRCSQPQEAEAAQTQVLQPDMDNPLMGIFASFEHSVDLALENDLLIDAWEHVG